VKALDQRVYNQKDPMSVQSIQTPDYIPSYEDMRVMSRKLSLYFAKQNGWVDGKTFFMHGFKKKHLTENELHATHRDSE
jgi:hypothetical protein